MKSITITEAVWNAIAERGKFGETEDDVLRRVFGIPGNTIGNEEKVAGRTRGRLSGRRSSFATDKLSSYISGNELRVSFASGPSSSWVMPDKTDKAALRVVRDQAVAFVENHAATIGQINAVKKTLTDSGYYLLK